MRTMYNYFCVVKKHGLCFNSLSCVSQVLILQGRGFSSLCYLFVVFGCMPCPMPKLLNFNIIIVVFTRMCRVVLNSNYSHNCINLVGFDMHLVEIVVKGHMSITCYNHMLIICFNTCQTLFVSTLSCYIIVVKVLSSNLCIADNWNKYNNWKIGDKK